MFTTAEELEYAFNIRKKVFVEEQGVPLQLEFDEFDHLEGQCIHILVIHDEQPVGIGRIRTVDGIGKAIISKLEEVAASKGLQQVKLHGQTQAQGFYEKLGYQASSAEFMEDGIPHVLMIKNLLT